jgi:bifunctional DNase/RNase
MKIPKKKIKIETLNNLSNPLELERIKLKYNNLLYHVMTEQVVVVLDADSKSIACPLSEFEGAMMSFVCLGCSINSHIKTIHQMYLGLLSETGSRLESAVVESKHGDVLYTTLEFRDKNNDRFRTISSFTDAIILTALAGADLYILKKVADEMEDFTSWTHYQKISDNTLYD